MSNVFIIGSGGREHALAWRLAQSPSVENVYVCPGNGGTVKDGKISNVAINGSDYKGMAEFCKANKVRLAVVGPEQPLVDGVVNLFQEAGIPVFGPSQKAAQLEASKAFSKEFMAKHNIPTARFEVFTDYEKAVAYVNACHHNVVVKASGLAAGKGVLLPNNKEEAIQALKEVMVDRVFGSAGDEVVVEEYMTGPEISVFALSDGYSTVLLPSIQDHKKIGEGDTGLNTGGMGAYGPTPFGTPALMKEIEATVVKPTIDGMRRSGIPYIGVLFVGLMLTPDGPRVLEYNCRFGDPETEVLMALFADDVDLVEVLEACVRGCLDSVKVSFKDAQAITVVAVSGGYPGDYPKGKVVTFGDHTGTQVFHAGTKANNGAIETSGGRVFAVTAVANTLREAAEKAYKSLSQLSFEGMYYRRDIAHQALDRTPEKESVTYAMAGVDIDAGNSLVERIKPYCKATRRTGCDAELGGFGALFDLAAIGYKDPILVSGTDGVGTKLKIAHLVGKHDTIGQDLVAMSVNDLIVQGAEPLFFLDYYACGRLTVDIAADVVKGIAHGCELANCGLIGGETAEMPSMYTGDDYDLAGFAVGVVERSQLLPQKNIQVGDVIIGLASSGIHSNGYSLARFLVSKSGVGYKDPAPFPTDKPGMTLGEVLLEPTRIYIRSLLPLLKADKIKGLVHITGGGFPENIPRVLPDNVAASVDASAWPLAPVFKWLKSVGNVENFELSRTFNCGIGMVIIVAPELADEILRETAAAGEKSYVIGKLVERNGDHVIMNNMDKAW